MQTDRLIKILLALIVVLSSSLIFEAGFYVAKTRKEARINEVLVSNNSKVQELNDQLNTQNGHIDELSNSLEDLLKTKTELEQQKNELEGQIAGLDIKKDYPFQVPSSGVVATYNGTYGGNMYGIRHLGIDIWTTLANSGQISSHRGNPVYAACSGKVDNIESANAGLTILCDEIDKGYDVPSFKVYTYYAHMGNAETKELFITVHPGQRVKKGDLIGYQGDLSSYFPQMRNVHLHFSVFTGLSETDKRGGALNPCLYIGGDCTRAGVIF